MTVIAKSRSAVATITDEFIHAVRARLADNKRIRRKLPIWGRLHIDRQLPFLCVYRRPLGGGDEGTEQLVTSEASYLLASADAKLRGGLNKLVHAIAATMTEQFGTFLVLEIWSGPPGNHEPIHAPANLQPHFQIVAPNDELRGDFLDAFDQSLSRIRIRKQAAVVRVLHRAKCCAASLKPLLSADQVRQLGCHVVGLQVSPVYRDPASDTLYPLVLREMERQLTRALHQAFFDFTRKRTTHQPKHFHVLGRRAVVKSVWEIDRQLAKVSDSFDFLLQVTPVNADQAWNSFESERFQRAPLFHYRPLPIDPVILKRKLYRVPIERIEDPALTLLFREKQVELDRRITMLEDINTKRFVHGSAQLFGEVNGKLLRLARTMLQRIPPRARDDTRGGTMKTSAFVTLARQEVAYYRAQSDAVTARVEVRRDIASGLMVSRGALLISKNANIPAARAQALLHHEVGTHLLTYYNGKAQPFRQLYSGLAGYEPLQEGLAVLAEYLVGGLSRPRLRVLAARVVAAHHLLAGASFVDTFRLLNQTYEFPQRAAFNLTMRIYRAGGLTKDAVYLQGLCEMLEYLGNGGRLDPLYVGKIATSHIPIIQELKWRKVLRPVPLRPRYLDDANAAKRLHQLRGGLTVLDLIGDRTK
jgi:uncharacterized protein (TIGR02421 family)